MRVGPPGGERPALLDGSGRLFDLSALTPDIDGTFFATGGPARVHDAHAAGDLPPLDGEHRIGPPVRPGKIVGIGLNYRDHAAETGGWIPEEPIVFLKAPDTATGAFDTLLLPRGSTKTDWEVELGVVIGRPARYLASEADAWDHIGGYTLVNDVSEREFQLERGGQWDKGKSCETFSPIGPWLVTPDEIADPQALDMRLSVNGVPRQAGNTQNMIFGVGHLVWYLSQFMVLYPGDLISTGTPAGVALGRPDPKPYLTAGDVVELAIDGLGQQRTPVRQS